MHATGGAHLADHLSSARDVVLADGAHWDAVVLQPYSDEAFNPEKQAAFRDALRAFVSLVRSAGAEPWLFMTWPYRDQPGMLEHLAVAYRAASAEMSVRVVPVGLAFEAARRSRPDLQLYAEGDVKHPSMAGTYLAAGVFYAAFYARSPEAAGFSGGLSLTDAMFLQASAWETVSQYYGWSD